MQRPVALPSPAWRIIPVIMHQAGGTSTTAASRLRAWYASVAPSLAYRDFRNLWLSTVAASVGMWMEQVALGWMVLELTDSPFMVGVAYGVRMAPFFFFGLVAGALADRVNRPLFLRFINAGVAGVAVTLAVLIFLDMVQVWHVLAIAFVMGALRALYMALRQSFAYDVVGSANALNGLAFLSISMRVGGLAGGPLAGAIIVAVGAGGAYLAMGGSYLVSVLALLLVKEQGQAAPTSREPMLQNLRGGFRLMRSNRVLASLTAMAAGTEVLGYSHTMIMPILARDVLGVGAAGLGVMMAFRSLGGMAGVALLAGTSHLLGLGKLLLACVGLFGLGLVLLGYSPTFLLVLVALLFVSAVASATDVLIPTLMQRSVSNEQRGRAMGGWALGIGVGPVGHMELGALAGALGPPVALAINGVALGAVAALYVLGMPRIRRL
ncbi:MAG: MFS transporter [Chloroflexi bacterium]|nr:MFS transporter [Chloroflexota bacterium]